MMLASLLSELSGIGKLVLLTKGEINYDLKKIMVKVIDFWREKLILKIITLIL